MNEDKRIKAYFQEIAKEFDAIYAQEKNFILRFLNFVFRRSVYQRFAAVLNECTDVKGKTVLDIGCGSGRYTVALAKMGATGVLGIDFAENMLQLARDLAENNQVSHICKFVNSDFLTINFDNKFHICLAVGVLEYIKQPGLFLKKMRNITQDKMIISLPVKWTARSALRKIRLSLKGCPVYFYTQRKIAKLLKSCQLDNYRIERFDRDYLVIIDLADSS